MCCVTHVAPTPPVIPFNKQASLSKLLPRWLTTLGVTQLSRAWLSVQIPDARLYYDSGLIGKASSLAPWHSDGETVWTMA